MNFPRLVYRSANSHHLARDQEEFDQLLSDGWFSSVPEAIKGEHSVKAPEVPAVEDNSPPTREELETQAKELGLKFTKKTSDEELGAMITEALES